MHARHPLFEKRLPGKRGADNPECVGGDTLERAQRVLSAVETKVIEPMRPASLAPRTASGRDGGARRAPWFADFVAECGPLKKQLTAKQEKYLAYRVQTFGDTDARNVLVEHNMGLVHHLCANMAASPKYPDLVAEGAMGLMRACETFDPRRELRFSTYAVHWIRARTGRFLQKLRRDDEPMVSDSGSMYVDGELGDRGTRKNRRVRHAVTSMDSFVHELEVSFGDTVVDTHAVDPETKAMLDQRAASVREVFAQIGGPMGDPRYAAIIERRLLAEEPETLDAISTSMPRPKRGPVPGQGRSAAGANACKKDHDAGAVFYTDRQGVRRKAYEPVHISREYVRLLEKEILVQAKQKFAELGLGEAPVKKMKVRRGRPPKQTTTGAKWQKRPDFEPPTYKRGHNPT